MSARRRRNRRWVAPVGVAVTLAALVGVLVPAVDRVREAAAFSD